MCHRRCRNLRLPHSGGPQTTTRSSVLAQSAALSDPAARRQLLEQCFVKPPRRAVIDVSLRGLMLTQPIHDKFHALRLRGMAEAFREQQESTDLQRLGFEERLGLLIDRQWNWRANRALERRLRNAR